MGGKKKMTSLEMGMGGWQKRPGLNNREHFLRNGHISRVKREGKGPKREATKIERDKKGSQDGEEKAEYPRSQRKKEKAVE